MDIEVGGQIQGISLGSFLQIVHMDKTTCTLKIYSNDDIGYLYLKDGTLVAAETGHLANVEAAYEILSWNKTVIIIDSAPIPNQNIAVSLMSILMEGLRRKDEKNALISEEAVDRKELDVEFDPDTYISKDDQIASQFVAQDKKTSDVIPPSIDLERTEKPLKMSAKPSAQPTPPDALPVDEGPAVPVEAGTDTAVPEAVTADSAFFEGEDEPAKKPPATSRIGRIFMLGILLAAMTFGSLYLYRSYLGKMNYNRVIDQAKNQKDLLTMKTVLSTYINNQEDDNRYIVDAISKMNDINDLMAVEKTIASMSLDDEYKNKTMGLYQKFLEERKGTFLEDYINVKLVDIPKSLEAYEFKKVNALATAHRAVRIKAYKTFIETYPESEHLQAVENLVAALSDDSYAELSQAAASCSNQSNWEPCIQLCDAFIRDFPDDTRLEDVKESRLKMVDHMEFEKMKFRSISMSFNDAKRMYIDYLQNNQNSSLIKDIREEIAALNRKIDFQVKWDETETYCKNPQIDLYQRIRELKDYMERDTSGLFKAESEALYRDLKREERTGQTRMAQELKDRQDRERFLRNQAEKERIQRERENLRQSESQRRAKDQRLGEETRRMAKTLESSGGRFRVNSDRTVTDSRTGLIWCLVDSYNAEGECMTYDQARSYVRNLNTGGYRDWRLPDSSELAVLYNSRPFYPSSGASWYWTLKSTSEAWNATDRAVVFYPDRKDEFEQVYKSKDECGFVHAVRP